MDISFDKQLCTKQKTRLIMHKTHSETYLIPHEEKPV